MLPLGYRTSGIECPMLGFSSINLVSLLMASGVNSMSEFMTRWYLALVLSDFSSAMLWALP